MLLRKKFIKIKLLITKRRINVPHIVGEIDVAIEGVRRKRRDLIRSLDLVVDEASRRRSSVTGIADQRARTSLEDRLSMRVHHQFAHHRLGMAGRQVCNIIRLSDILLR